MLWKMSILCSLRSKILDCIDEHGADRFVFIKSLKICQRKDAEKTAPACIHMLKINSLMREVLGYTWI